MQAMPPKFAAIGEEAALSPPRKALMKLALPTRRRLGRNFGVLLKLRVTLSVFATVTESQAE